MKKHFIAFGALFLFAGAGLVATAQDAPGVSSVEARLAARRAAEEIGAEQRITPISPTAANLTEASTDEQAADALRKASLAAAYKEIQASSNSMLVNKSFLQIVWQRNVFDPARAPYIPRIYRPAPVVESFSLRGISEIVGKGFVALFGGNGVPSSPPTRVVGDLVGGDDGRQFKITAITQSNVTLLDTKFTARLAGTSAAGRTSSALAGPEFVLNLDEQLTRTDGGLWTTSAYIPVYPTFAARAPLDAATTFGSPRPFVSGPGSLPAPGNPRVPPRTGVPPGRRNSRTPGGRGGAPGFAAPAAVTAPAAAPDPIVVARLQSQRSAQQ